MTHIHIVRPFYIDNELQFKKIDIFSKKTPQGGLAPILGPIYGKVPEREPIFLNDSSKLSMDTQKLIPVEILTPAQIGCLLGELYLNFKKKYGNKKSILD